MLAYFFILILLFYLKLVCFKQLSLASINIIIAILLAFFVGIRAPGIGWDYYSYENYYNSINALSDSYFFYNTNIKAEYLFQLMVSICKTFGISFRVFLGLFSFITTFFLGKALIKLCSKYYFEAIIIYFCYFFLQFQFNAIRHGLLCSLQLYAFSFLLEKKRWCFITISLISAGFHSLGYLLLLLLPFSLIKFKTNAIYFCLSVFLVYSFYFSSSDILFLLFPNNYYAQLYNKLLSGSRGPSLSLGFFVNLLLIIYCTAYRKNYYQNTLIMPMINFLFFSCIVTLFFWDMQVFIERIGSFFNTALLIVIPFFCFKNKKKNESIYLSVVIVFLSYAILYLLKNINTNMNGIYTFKPYYISF